MTTRRKFLAGMAIAPLAVRTSWSQSSKVSGGAMFFVGTGTKTGSKGIYLFQLDSSTGELKSLGLAAEASTPSFLALSPDEQFLFAVNEIDTYQGQKTGAVSSYALDKASGKLTLVNTAASGGAGPCHLSTDKTGRVLLVANYTGGSAASFQIASDGRLSEAVSQFHYDSGGPGPGQDKERQEASHAHRATVSPDNRFVLINDLGLDRIHIYRLDADTAKLTPNDPADWKAAPGSGPRALRFHPNGRWAYCVNELTSSVSQLGWDASNGTLTLIGDTPLLPPGYQGATSTASEIIFDNKGLFAYVANRGDDFIMGFAVDQNTGKLTSPRRTPCGGKTPRHIALDPTGHWLLVADQNSNLIAVFRRDPKNGWLPMTGPTFPVQSPQCIVFV